MMVTLYIPGGIPGSLFTMRMAYLPELSVVAEYDPPALPLDSTVL
jgi:hypothetical protein